MVIHKVLSTFGEKGCALLKRSKSSWDLDAVTYLGNKEFQETFKELDLEIEKLIINFYHLLMVVILMILKLMAKF